MRYFLLIFIFISLAFSVVEFSTEQRLQMPYRKEGLSEREAAEHLLSRLSFGGRPGEAEKLLSMGLEKWVQQQLGQSLPGTEVEKRLSDFDALSLDNETIVNRYLNAGQVLRMMQKNGTLSRDSMAKLEKADYRKDVLKLMQQQGLKPPQELNRQLFAQKLIRAVYSENQLQELMTDFWFNHFNVSVTKGQSQPFVLTYERDAIRPHTLGKFESLLKATAQHPAMLFYLDNASSGSDNNQMNQRIKKMAPANSKLKRAAGLNENYAREVMELHTLGVDGGYVQADVTEVARALTGWTVRPMMKDGYGGRLSKLQQSRLGKNMATTEGDFLFLAVRHDQGEKTVLGKKYTSNGGLNEGLEVLHQLASHPSTARFICKKIATRFVSDTPSVALVTAMAAVFTQSGGDIKQTMIAMLNSREFWKKEVLRSKIKSPFELVVSAIRATNADLRNTNQLNDWCARMGQKIYSYAAPTGFPDKASFWVNTGSLLNRMNFGLAIGAQRIPGVAVNLLALNNNHEPESIEDALKTYSAILLPGRNQTENINRLTNLVRDESLQSRLDKALASTQSASTTQEDMTGGADMMGDVMARSKGKGKGEGKKIPAMEAAVSGQVAHVVGIIIGSPEFQRK
ncbi:MAG: DUF1800 domain-containing protein [Chitinophagaceae bacterium]|nr:DUF1800 domain-containing protein [Chitinophagaceae bacterium]